MAVFCDTYEGRRHLKFAIHGTTLKFADSETERRYVSHNYAENSPFSRLTILIGITTMLAFLLLDSVVVPEIFYYSLAVRLFFCTPLLLSTIYFSFANFSPLVKTRILSLSLIIPNISILLIILNANPDGAAYYATGIIVTSVFCASTWRMGFIYPTLYFIIAAAAYLVIVTIINPIEYVQLANSAFFLFCALGAMTYHSYMYDLQQRAKYVARERLLASEHLANQLLIASEAANRSKGEFLAIMSHELRTPLNAIIGFSDMISSEMIGPVGQPRYIEYAKDINSSGQHLLTIINEILDFSKRNSNSMEIEELEFDPALSIEKALRMLSVRATSKNINLTFHNRTTGIAIRGDEQFFGQAVINLLSNAVKFTPDNGRVDMSLARILDGGIELRVCDTGIGIKHEDLERVFEPFVQVEGAMARKFEGTGLGLPMVRKIAAAHGGSVRLESDGKTGTTAILLLPVGRVLKIAA